MRVSTQTRVLLWILILALAGCAGPLVREAPPEEEAQPEPGMAAIQSLVHQARLEYGEGDYQGAIAAAERGLRIDRREPELYLLLAQSYLALARPQQADEFARQGLRFSSPDSVLHQALKAVREQTHTSGPTLTF